MKDETALTLLARYSRLREGRGAEVEAKTAIPYTIQIARWKTWSTIRRILETPSFLHQNSGQIARIRLELKEETPGLRTPTSVDDNRFQSRLASPGLFADTMILLHHSYDYVAFQLCSCRDGSPPRCRRVVSVKTHKQPAISLRGVLANPCVA